MKLPKRNIALYKKILITLFLLNSVSASCSDPTEILADVLIVGGGPAGLTLANICQKNEIKYLLIEKNAGTILFSKATGIHVNSMQLLSTLGLANEIIKQGVKLNKSTFIHNDEVMQTTVFKHGDLPYEINMSISQENLEHILLEQLKKEFLLYRHSLQNIDTTTMRCFVKDEIGNVIKIIKYKFIAAADGGKSTVRKQLNLPFEGETAQGIATSFDAKVLTPVTPGEMFIHSNNDGRLVMVPINKEGMYKFSGRLSSPDGKEELSPIDLADIVLKRAGIQIELDSIRGLTAYHTHSRISSKFRINDIFLLGDAAHVFYPAGGYGLNIAIGDAFTLGDGLIQYFKSDGDCHLLDQYEALRKEVAVCVQDDALRKRMMSMDVSSKKVATQETQVYENKQGDK